MNTRNRDSNQGTSETSLHLHTEQTNEKRRPNRTPYPEPQTNRDLTRPKGRDNRAHNLKTRTDRNRNHQNTLTE